MCCFSIRLAEGGNNLVSFVNILEAHNTPLLELMHDDHTFKLRQVSTLLTVHMNRNTKSYPEYKA